MLRTLALVAIAGMVVVLSSFAQTSPTCSDPLPPPQNINPAGNLDLSRLALVAPEIQSIEGLAQFTAGPKDVVPGAKEAGFFGSVLAQFLNEKKDKVEIRLHSFDKVDSASAEDRANNFIIARVKEAEAAKDIIEADPRSKDADKSKAAQDLNKDVKDCFCLAKDVAFIRATSADKSGSANSIKLYFRLRGIVVSVEMANTSPQVAKPPSPDDRDAMLFKVAVAQKNKLCASQFIKPKT